MANTSEISALVQFVIQTLPPDRYSIKSDLVDQSGNDYIEIQPNNPRAARIRILNLNDPGSEYALVLGKGTIVEIPISGNASTGLSAQDELVQVCKAVFEGGFTERIVSFFGKDLLIIGCARLRNRTIRSMSGVPLPYPFWHKVEYEPYG
jgi:hypothetical protein